MNINKNCHYSPLCRRPTAQRVGSRLAGLMGMLIVTSSLANQPPECFPAMSCSPVSGISFSNQTKSIQANLRGYTAFDMFKIQGDTPELNSGSNLRWARMYLSGDILNDWGYSVGYDFKASNTNRLTDAYIAYNGWSNMSLVAGQITPNVSMTGWIEDIDEFFLETPLSTSLFTPDYSRGIIYSINNSQLALYTSIYYPGIEQDFSGRKPLGASARLIYSPIHTQTHAFSFSAAAIYGQTDSTNTTSYSTPPELVTRDNSTTLDTGLIPNVTNIATGIAEACYIHGPWNVYGEYVHNLLWRNMDQQNLQFNGGYVALSYFLTGESMNYNFPAGIIIKPDDINNQRLGAWQIATRISYANLNDKEVSGGRETNITLGLNWYINQYVALRANYIRAMINLANDAHTNANIYALRAQIRLG